MIKTYREFENEKLNEDANIFAIIASIAIPVVIGAGSTVYNYIDKKYMTKITGKVKDEKKALAGIISRNFKDDPKLKEMLAKLKIEKKNMENGDDNDPYPSFKVYDNLIKELPVYIEKRLSNDKSPDLEQFKKIKKSLQAI